MSEDFVITPAPGHPLAIVSASWPMRALEVIPTFHVPRFWGPSWILPELWGPEHYDVGVPPTGLYKEGR